MNNYRGIVTTLLICFALSFAGIPDAEAKRFGSSRSFGGKSSFGSPFRRSTKSNPSRSASQQKAYNQNQSARQNMSRRGGFMGMLGGLALGGLLGAMMFGGAFEGINFMDILLFGGIAFLLFKLFAAKNSARRQPVYSENNTQKTDFFSDSNSSQQNSANFNTDVLFDKQSNQKSAPDKSFNQNSYIEESTPVGFDEFDFLEGAKQAFSSLQKAWDEHDLAEIRALTTDKAFAEIQQQLKDSPEANQTDVLKLDAELLSIRELGVDLEAVVLFDSIIREEINSQAEQVREVWHFSKNKNSLQPKWFLDGIQQLEQ